LPRLSVFKSRKALLLDYIPPSLPHRESQLKELERYFDPVLHEEGGMSVKVHIYGQIGTGKTALCKRFGRNIEAEAKELKKRLKYVHINLAYTPKPYHIMTELLAQVSFATTSRTGLSPEEMLTAVARTIEKEDYSLVIALDEVDTYVNERRDPKIFYLFSRIHELYRDSTPRVSLIYISRSLEWLKKLDRPTLDTIGRTSAIYLQPYGIQELRDILNYRAEEAFQLGAVPEPIIDFIADVAVSYGDVRYGLELLLEAGGQAEVDYSTAVNAEHVRRGYINIPRGVNGAYYPSDLSLHKQFLLKAVVETLGVDPYVDAGDVYENYQSICKEYEEEPEEEAEIQTYLRDLKGDGYIFLKAEDGKTLVTTVFPLDRMSKALEESLEYTRRTQNQQ